MFAIIVALALASTRTYATMLIAMVAVAALTGTATASCRLLLVRHGETNYNADGRIQGRLESELTELGHSQARAVGTWLSTAEGGTVDQVFVSPRKRTLQTLDNIRQDAAALPQASVRPGLREIELTMWEGQFRSDLRDAQGNSDAARWAQWKANPSEFVFVEDAHSPLGDLKRRAADEWASLLASTPADSRSLIVAHGAFNRVFMLTALGLPVDDVGFRDDHFAFVNCAAVELRWVPGAVHASAWRRRYPAESPWTTREEEVARVRAMNQEKAEL